MKNIYKRGIGPNPRSNVMSEYDIGIFVSR